MISNLVALVRSVYLNVGPVSDRENTHEYRATHFGCAVVRRQGAHRPCGGSDSDEYCSSVWEHGQNIQYDQCRMCNNGHFYRSPQVLLGHSKGITTSTVYL